MHTTAIIAEYNPFHKGHEYLIRKARESGATHVVIFMSGNYVQRGEPALFEKQIRARAAIDGGADLVIEIPVPYAVSTAERFAFGGVSLANGLGIVDTLTFGVETENLGSLLKIAEILETKDFYTAMRPYLDKGESFATAREYAVRDRLGSETAEVLHLPNNILGIEYLRQLIRSRSKIEPQVFRRIGEGYHSEQGGEYASASAFRHCWAVDPVAALELVSHESADRYVWAREEGAHLDYDRYHDVLLASLRRLEEADFARIPDLSEGIENRLFQSVRKATTYEELISIATTKRYASSRLRRLFLSAFLSVPTDLAKQTPPYLRVLAANNRGFEVLSESKKHATMPVSTSLMKLERLNDKCKAFTQVEARSTDLYNALLVHRKPCGTDYQIGME